MAIETRELVVQFPGKQEPALKNISMTIPDGSFAVLVGASGSGKSTLLHALAGLLTPTSGVVTDNGETVTGPHPRRGVAFQRDVLFPWMTVADNIQFALAAKSSAKRDRATRIRELLGLVGLREDVSRQRPAQLSGGMRQRVSIARVLAGEPTVMLMDEPFAALDALTRLRMQDLLIDLWTRLNRTIVFVTHDIDEAIRLGDTVSVLRDGRIVDHITSPLSRPRPADALADQPRYTDIRKTLHHQLGIDHTVH
ncbi:MAG: transporter [Mycobacterium sp.]|jgi:NitT/TauT family transport system ATP-binding protein|nr:transporter [Mycobacterium sp.]